MKKILICLMLLMSATLLYSADEKTNAEGKDKAIKEASADTNEIIWHRYDKGIKLAKETGRFIMINFTTSWCGYCKKMNRTTFKDSKIINTLNNDFVAIKVDCESKLELDVDGYKIAERDLARAEFGVRGYPVYWFLKSDLEKISKIEGYRNANDFYDALFFLKEELHKKMKWKDYRKNGGHKGKF